MTNKVIQSARNQYPVFLQAGCPSCRPTNSVKAVKGDMYNTFVSHKKIDCVVDIGKEERNENYIKHTCHVWDSHGISPDLVRFSRGISFIKLNGNTDRLLQSLVKKM